MPFEEESINKRQNRQTENQIDNVKFKVDEKKKKKSIKL